MAIPEAQLETWSNQGATVSSADTHKSIRNALEKHAWPNGMNYNAYLQGSYANYTNIRGNSDVDLVIESSSVSYSNLNEDEKRRLGIGRGSYDYRAFRDEVLKALTSYYGANLVDASGQKSIKIAASGNRLAADAVPCITYKHYNNWSVVAEGITFWTQSSNQQVINFPKIHLQKGSAKNQRTKNRYKPSIRMFKNARERILANNPVLQGSYPSYFVECLLYNVPDSCFSNSYSETFYDVVKFLLSQNSHLSQYYCQNEQLLLFGSHSTQWNITEARDFVDQLVILWDQWR